MKMHLLISTAFVFLQLTSLAQVRTWDWATGSLQSGNASTFGMTMDSEKNIYTVGYFQGPMVIGDTTIPNKGGNDIFLVKISSNGDFLWARGLGGSSFYDLGYGVKVDSMDNVIITGSFDVSALIGSQTFTSTYYRDVLIVKYDSNGNLLWARQGKGSGAEDYAYDVETDSAGYIYAGGVASGSMNFNGTIINEGGFITKYDPSGNLSKVIPMSGQFASCKAISLDRKANIFAAGMYVGTTVLDTITLSGNSGWKIFLAKYNPAGNVQWVKTPKASSLPAYSEAVVTDEHGATYISGIFQDTLQFEDTTLISVRQKTWNYDPFQNKFDSIISKIWNVYIAKYDSEGTFKWARIIKSNRDVQGSDLFCDQSGGLYISGHFTGKLTVGASEFNTVNHAGFFSKMDYNGNFLYVQDAKSVKGEAVYMSGVVADQKAVYATGYAIQVELGDIKLHRTNFQFFVAKNIGSTVRTPVVNSFSPASVNVLDSVTVKGKYFLDVTDVLFHSGSLNFRIVNDSILKFEAPSTAATDNFSLVSSSGSRRSASTLEVSGTVTSTLKLEEKEVKFYPNPANKTVHFTDLKAPGQISVISLDGRVLKKISTSYSDYEMNIEDLSKGIYVIVSEEDNGFRRIGKIAIIK